MNFSKKSQSRATSHPSRSQVYSGKPKYYPSTERLFVNSDTFDVQTCAISNSEYNAERFQGIEDLKVYLNGLNDSYSANDTDTTIQHLFFLHQATSRSRLCITEEAFNLLLAHLQIPASFLSIVTPFGAESGPFTDGCSKFYAISEKRVSKLPILHTAYILKHVEAHGRSGTVIPWSIRQMAVYQKHGTSTSQSSLLIQTSNNAQKKISALLKKGDMAKFRGHWTYIHEVYLETVAINWDSYIKLLDHMISNIDLEVRFSQLGDNGHNRVTFEDLKHLNQYANLLVRIQHTLGLNIEVLGMLAQAATQRQASEENPDAERYTEFQSAVRTCHSEHIFLKGHTNLVRDSAERLAVQLRDTIALQDNNLMLTLTSKTISEAQMMRTITFIVLLYLPASFTSSFLSMDFLHVESLQGILHINASQDMWMYLAITAPLMLMTTMGWWLWDVAIQRRERARLGKGKRENSDEV